ANDDSRLADRRATVLALHPARRVRVDGALCALAWPHTPAISARGVRPRDAARADQRADLSVLRRAKHAFLEHRRRAGPALPRAALERAPRGSRTPLFARRHSRVRNLRRRRVQLVLPARLETLLSEVVRRADSVGEGALPAHARAARTSTG